MQILNIPKNTPRKLKAIGINVYGGGFTIGVLHHFQVLAQFEEFKLGAKTFTLNFPTIHRPLVPHTEWPIKEYAGKADLVFANPPCVPWSDASSYSSRTGQVGTRKGKTIADRFNDPLLLLTDHTMRAALKLKPRIFISESVENAYNVGVKHYEPYRKMWQKAGYSVTYFLTDAVLHGAPCRRRRFHFIAHDCKLQLPAAIETCTPVTVRDAIGDLVDRPFDDEFQHDEAHAGAWATGPYRKFLRKVRPFGRLLSVLPPDFDGVRPSVFCRRLSWDFIASTIMGFSKLIHPDGKRWITYREGLRLMTYPDDFRIHARSDVDAYDAVLPVIGEFLSRVAKRSIQADIRSTPSHNVVDWRPYGKQYHGREVKAA